MAKLELKIPADITERGTDPLGIEAQSGSKVEQPEKFHSE
jgi:hypothetical protein